MQPPAPVIHPLQLDYDATALVAQLIELSGAGESAAVGLHVLVHVSEAGNTGYGRVVHATFSGATLQRWIRHARRGASEGGWSQQHHPRGEQAIGAWKERSAATLDRLLIDHCKQAWRLEQAAPYIAEFAVLDLDACGVEAPPAAE